MPNYRRAFQPGSCCFFTLVTAERRPILDDARIELLRQVVREVRHEFPFVIDAWVVLPDHIHAIWRLPDGDANFSKRWGLIKARFSKRSNLSAEAGLGQDARVWQPRFWEHLIRDELDWHKHMDYVHFNPVKHGLVHRVQDWPYSTFHRLVADGFYELDWGVSEEDSNRHTFGECTESRRAVPALQELRIVGRALPAGF